MARVLKVEKREEFGTSRVKKLRRSGYIPGVIYGHAGENYPVKINLKDFQHFLAEIHGETQLITVKLDGEEKQVFIKDIQRDPLYGKPLHVDFQIAYAGEKIELTVPVILKGEAKGEKLGGLVEHITRELTIYVVPSKSIPHIEVDISDLDIGDSIHIKDLGLDPDIEILEPPDTPIVTVLAPKKGVVEEEVTEEAVTEEGAAEAEEEKKE